MADEVIVTVTCIACGDSRQFSTDYDNEEDVARIGIDVTEALRAGHVLIVAQYRDNFHLEVLN